MSPFPLAFIVWRAHSGAPPPSIATHTLSLVTPPSPGLALRQVMMTYVTAFDLRSRALLRRTLREVNKFTLLNSARAYARSPSDETSPLKTDLDLLTS